jgi:hypothetical protein
MAGQLTAAEKAKRAAARAERAAAAKEAKAAEALAELKAEEAPAKSPLEMDQAELQLYRAAEEEARRAGA